MMNSSDFIKSMIGSLVERMPYIRCRYEFHDASYNHFIEVVPNFYYKQDSVYIKLEEEICKEFEEKFPYELITFITDDSVYKITEPIFIKEGNLYKPYAYKVKNYSKSIFWLSDSHDSLSIQHTPVCSYSKHSSNLYGSEISRPNNFGGIGYWLPCTNNSNWHVENLNFENKFLTKSALIELQGLDYKIIYDAVRLFAEHREPPPIANIDFNKKETLNYQSLFFLCNIANEQNYSGRFSV
jgi:hypothetical protein